MNEVQKNQRIADHIRSQSEWNGQHFEGGSVVALLDGQVIALATSLDEALAALRAVEPDTARGMLVPVDRTIDVIR